MSVAPASRTPGRDGVLCATDAANGVRKRRRSEKAQREVIAPAIHREDNAVDVSVRRSPGKPSPKKNDSPFDGGEVLQMSILPRDRGTFVGEYR